MSPVPLTLNGEDAKGKTESRTYLHPHNPHPHTARDVNAAHQVELHANLNARLAVGLTKAVGTMWCAYLFTALAVVGLFGLLGLLNPFTFLLATWVSQMFLQLVFLPILSVGQAVLGRKSELLAEEQFATTQKSYHDIEEIMLHLSKQDEELLSQSANIQTLLSRIEDLVRPPDDASEIAQEGTHIVRAHRRISKGSRRIAKKTTPPLITEPVESL